MLREIRKDFESSKIQVHKALLFDASTNKVFSEFLTTNQSYAPKAATMAEQYHKFFCSLMVRFVSSSAFGGNKLVTEVEFTLAYNIKDDNDFLIGEQCRQNIRDRDSNGLTSSKLKEFHIDVRAFFKTLSNYLLKKLSLSDPILSKK